MHLSKLHLQVSAIARPKANGYVEAETQFYLHCLLQCETQDEKAVSRLAKELQESHTKFRELKSKLITRLESKTALKLPFLKTGFGQR